MNEEKLNIRKSFWLRIKRKKMKLNSDMNFHEWPQPRNYLSMSFIHSSIKAMFFCSSIYFVLEGNDFQTVIL